MKEGPSIFALSLPPVFCDASGPTLLYDIFSFWQGIVSREILLPMVLSVSFHLYNRHWMINNTEYGMWANY